MDSFNDFCGCDEVVEKGLLIINHCKVRKFSAHLDYICSIAKIVDVFP